MPKSISFKDLLKATDRKDATRLTIKKSKKSKVYKLKLRCSRYLYTCEVVGEDRIKSVRQSLRPTLTIEDVDSKKK